MRRLYAILLLLAVTTSCSESPPAKPADPGQTTAAPETETHAEVAPDPQQADSRVESSSDAAVAKQPQPDRTSPLAVGEQAPNFELQDQEGNPRSLDALLAESKVALVFYRSAEW